MSHQPIELADAVIDSKEFVRSGRRLEGELQISRLERLADLLADTGGWLRVELAGASGDSEEKLCLRLKVAGSLNLSCQRCLGPLEWPVAIDSVLQLVDDAETWPEGDEAELDAAVPDAVTADRELAVLPLVEDEILLSLPIAPRHKRCVAPLGGDVDSAPSPFAVLAQLKKH